MGKKAKSTSFKGQRVTPAGKRFLEDRAPKLRENPKKLLALRGSKTSERTSSALQTLAELLQNPGIGQLGLDSHNSFRESDLSERNLIFASSDEL